MATFSPRPTEFEFPWFDTRNTYDQSLETAITANETAAGLAQNRADSAFDNAGSAQSTADQAVDDAAAAQTTANTGVSNAATAQNRADSAFSNAATAQSDATQALADAATAQAKADAALPVHLPPATGTDLNTLTAVGVHPVPWLTGSLALNFPVASTAGVVEVLPYDGVKLVQRFTPTTGTSATRGTWTRRRTDTSTWGAWSFQPTQRIDNSAGRAIYTWDDTANRETLISYDSGWRDIMHAVNSEFIAVSGSTGVSIRRKGSRVTLRVRISADPDGPLFAVTPVGGRTLITAIPTGFVPSDYVTYGTVSLGGVGFSGTVSNASSQTLLRVVIPPQPSIPPAWGVHQLFGEVSWLTDQPLPTTLPGTAVGTIPFN